MPNKIIFNGQEYASVEAMPPEARQAYERLTQILPDTDKNGVPDILEGLGTLPVQTTTQIVINGQTYSSLDDMPPKVRRTYESLIRSADLQLDPTPRQPSATPLLEPNVISPEDTDQRLRLAGVVIGVLILIILGLVAVIMFSVNVGGR